MIGIRIEPMARGPANRREMEPKNERWLKGAYVRGDAVGVARERKGLSRARVLNEHRYRRGYVETDPRADDHSETNILGLLLYLCRMFGPGFEFRLYANNRLLSFTMQQTW